MSEDNENTVPELWSLIRGQASFESAEEALESLVQLKEVEFPEIFTNRDTELDSEENDGISINFTHEENYNRLGLSTDSNNQLQLVLTLQDNDVREAGEVIDKLLEYVSPLTIEEKTIIKQYNKPFDSLDISIDDDRDFDLVGVRLRHGGIDYIVQEDEQEDDFIRVTGTDESQIELEEPPEDAIITETIEQTDTFIKEVL